MNTPENEAPDHGEPRHPKAPHYLLTSGGKRTYLWLTPEQFNKATECVNACAGMADPEKEIQAMRERIDELESGSIHSCGDHCKRPNCVTRRENKAMREAIKEAHEALVNVSPTFGRTPAQDAALAKLKLFLP